jgi:hypothetical protein
LPNECADIVTCSQSLHWLEARAVGVQPVACAPVPETRAPRAHASVATLRIRARDRHAQRGPG